MQWDAAEIEAIVRRVLTQLSIEAAPFAGKSVNNESSSASRSNLPERSDIPEQGELTFADRVITVDRLKGLSKDTTEVRIANKAIVTPAALDWLRERKITIARGQAKHSPGNRLAPLYIAGSVRWMDQLAKRVCPQQGFVDMLPSGDDPALRQAKAELRKGRQAIVLIVDHAHACCWQANRDDAVRAAVVEDWRSLGEILDEVPVNLLIMSARHWNVASMANAIRAIYSHRLGRTRKGARG